MKKLLILSGKGGTGKTTVAAALIRFAGAKAFADCDVDAPNLHLVAAVSASPEETDFFGGSKAQIRSDRCTGCGACLEICRFGAIRREDGRCQVVEYACEGCGVCCHVCPEQAVSLVEDVAGKQQLYRDGERVFSTAELKMGRGNSGKLVTAVKLALLKAAPRAELAIIDGSPGIGCQVMASASGADAILLVAEPSASGVSDLKRLLQAAEVFRTPAAVCVNKWDVSPEYTAEVEKFCAEAGVPFVGRIPYDSAAAKAVNEGKSLAEVDCPARDALRGIFEQVCSLLDCKIMS